MFKTFVHVIEIKLDVFQIFLEGKVCEFCSLAFLATMVIYVEESGIRDDLILILSHILTQFDILVIGDCHCDLVVWRDNHLDNLVLRLIRDLSNGLLFALFSEILLECEILTSVLQEPVDSPVLQLFEVILIEVI